jgi:hypothetical protein
LNIVSTHRVETSFKRVGNGTYNFFFTDPPIYKCYTIPFCCSPRICGKWPWPSFLVGPFQVDYNGGEVMIRGFGEEGSVGVV